MLTHVKYQHCCLFRSCVFKMASLSPLCSMCLIEPLMLMCLNSSLVSSLLALLQIWWWMLLVQDQPCLSLHLWYARRQTATGASSFLDSTLVLEGWCVCVFFFMMRIGWVSGIKLAALKECILNDGLSASGKIFSGKRWICPTWVGSHWSFHKASLAQVNMAFEIIKGKNKNLSAFIKSNLCLHIRICITQHHAEGWLASRSSWLQRRRMGLLINGPGSKRGQHHY